MSDRFAQNRESRKYKVQRPRKEGQAGRAVQIQVAVVWHPIDLAAGASAGGPQGTEAPGPLGFLGAEGQSASRVRELRDKEPADVEKDKGFQKQG